jgi:hypothetical protein
MIIVGCDYHPGFQQIAYVNTETGEVSERRLGHKEEAEQFDRELGQSGGQLRVGMEARGHARWFERVLLELECELLIGDAAPDSFQTSAQAENGSPGRTTAVAVAGGRSVSECVGAGGGQPGSTATVVASPSAGRDAHAHHEPAARGGPQRRTPPQEGAVAAGRTSTAGVVSARPLGQVDVDETCSTCSIT